MISTEFILASHVCLVLFIGYTKWNSELVKQALIGKFNLIDITLFLFIIINAILNIYSPIASLMAMLFLALGKTSSLLTGTWLNISLLLVGVLALILSVHVIPGFYRPLILEEVISSNQKTFQLFLSTDKAFVGLILFAYVVNQIMPVKPKWILISVLAPITIILTALLFGLSLDLKYGNYLLWFIPLNLMITCLAEEIFFRSMIQKWLSKTLPDSVFGSFVTISLVTYLFLLAHGIYFPDSLVDLLYLLASFLYALIYYLTGSVLLSILTHFILNLLHILLLEYPLF